MSFRPDERVYWRWATQREYAEIAAGHRTQVSVYDSPDSVSDLYSRSTDPDFPRIIGFIRSLVPDKAESSGFEASADVLAGSDEVHFRRISGVSKDGDFVIYTLGDAVGPETS